MGQTWGPPGSYGPQMGPMLAPGTLLSGMLSGSLASGHVVLDGTIMERVHDKSTDDPLYNNELICLLITYVALKCHDVLLLYILNVGDRRDYGMKQK